MIDKIIHIALDEKFINSAYWQFEKVSPNKNYFYIFLQNKNEELKLVTQQPNVIKFQPDIDLNLFIEKLTGNEVFVFHSLAPNFFPLILKLPKSITCIWFCFGYEVYLDKHFYNENRLLDKITKAKFGIAAVDYKTNLREKLRPYKRLLSKNLAFSYLENKKAIFKRMNYLGSSFDEEHQAIQKLIHQKKKLFPFWYYPIEQIVPIDEAVIEGRTNVLIGNSGFASGNHLDVFAKLKDYNFESRKIIVPLSYGKTTYIPIVLKEGKAILKDNFEPLTDFMPLSEYNQILKKCGVAILNNFRQQAVGNTIALLWFGSKVFLSNKNPFYHYLKRIGVVIYCYEKDLNSEKDLELLSFDKIIENRKQLFKNLNTEFLLIELKNELEKL